MVDGVSGGAVGVFFMKSGALSERFWSKVRIAESCWLWSGRIREDGYAEIDVGNKSPFAHRVAYELTVGPIPEGMEIDHKCHNIDILCIGGKACQHRRCVNPAHLEAVVPSVNTRRAHARKTHCRFGHPYTEENVIVRKTENNTRKCRICHNQRHLERYYRLKREREEQA